MSEKNNYSQYQNNEMPPLREEHNQNTYTRESYEPPVTSLERPQIPSKREEGNT